MASALRHGVSGLDTTMRLTLAVLALASGVYTYLGVRDLLDGSPLITFFVPAGVSAACAGCREQGVARRGDAAGLGDDHRHVLVAQRRRARGLRGH
jgi:hypothetical protein